VDDYHDTVVVPIPLPRVGQPDEIAAVVAFVATDDASSISGQTVYVNRGVHQLAARPIPILRTTVHFDTIPRHRSRVTPIPRTSGAERWTFP
jgi:Enoyl-(Acyl carrier protein) reductase